MRSESMLTCPVRASPGSYFEQELCQLDSVYLQTNPDTYKLISSVAAEASVFGSFARKISTCSGQRPM